MRPSPADAVAQLLIDLGVGSTPGGGDSWPVYVGGEPDKPDDCVTVYDTDGTPDGRIQLTGSFVDRPGVQVRVRARGYRAGYEKASEARRELSAVRGVEVIVGPGTGSADGLFVHCMSRIRRPLSLGRQTTSAPGRDVFTLNLEVVLTTEES